MPSIEKRKILSIGGERRSLAITLPQGWAKFWDLRKGQTVTVISDEILVVVPPGRRDLLQAARRFVLRRGVA